MRIQDEPEGRWYKNSEVIDISRICFFVGIGTGIVMGIGGCLLLLWIIGFFI